jgi:hypothetical protein
MKKTTPFLSTCCLASLLVLRSTISIAQCVPAVLGDPVLQAITCDTSTNDVEYWSATYWWDTANESHNLAEVTTDFHIAFHDTCPNNDFQIRCLLYLDLDYNGVAETLLDSDSFPNPGGVSYGNITGSGTLREFDQRPVAPGAKWKFALEAIPNGDTIRTYLRWNTVIEPTVFIKPELPLGNHRIRWEIREGAQLVNVIEYPVVLKDCAPPTILCQNGISVSLMPNQMIQLEASDFLLSIQDNISPTALLNIGIRKAGNGTGFPVDANGNLVTSVNFDCAELGLQGLELWGIDLQGNARYCETTVTISDDLNACNGSPIALKVCASAPCSGFFDETQVELKYAVGGTTMTSFLAANCQNAYPLIPPNTEVTVRPFLDDNPSNGVATYDLVIMGKHLQGVDTLDTPFQWVAADANLDGQFDNADIVTCREQLLGIQPLPQSWRFFEASYVFPPGNPLAAPLPESITFNSDNVPPNSIQFIGVKICDLTCGNIVGFFDLPDEDGHLIGAPQPNPTLGPTQLPLRLATPENVFLQLFDAAGRLCYQQTLNLPAGNALFDIPESAMPQKGIYLWRAQAGATIKSGRLSRF